MVLRPSLSYSSISILILLFFLNCDSTNDPQSLNNSTPVIESVILNPSRIEFTLDADGYKDTVVTVTLTANVNLFGSEEAPGFVIRDLSNREIISSGSLTRLDPTIYQTTFGLETATTLFSKFVAEVFVFDEFGNISSAEHHIELVGFSNSRPEILFAENPEEVNRPSTGEILTKFTAKVTDADGQATLDRVLVRVIDLVNGEDPNSPYQMFDDGQTYDDVTANDSLYTITFPIAAIPGRETQSFFIEYFAVDQGGIYSDTTRNTFRITNIQ